MRGKNDEGNERKGHDDKNNSYVPDDEFKETTLDIISSMKESGNNITEITITGGDQKGTMKIIVKEEI